MKIRNAGDNLWTVVSIDVDINGKKKGTWDGFRKVIKFKTISILVEMEKEQFGELVFPGPAQGESTQRLCFRDQPKVSQLRDCVSGTSPR